MEPKQNTEKQYIRATSGYQLVQLACAMKEKLTGRKVTQEEVEETLRAAMEKDPHLFTTGDDDSSTSDIE